MKKEVDIFKVKDKKLPKHDQRVLVKKKGITPFCAIFQCWLGDMFWYVPEMDEVGKFNGRHVKLEITDKWMPLYNKYFN